MTIGPREFPVEALVDPAFGQRGVAKYERLRRGFAAAIEEGRLAAGARIPPEQALAARTGLSLGTVQRALRELVSEGYLVRRQGSGTFVADRGRRLDEPLHARFVDDDNANEPLPVFTRLVGRRRVEADGPWHDALGRDASGIFRLDRIVDIGGRFRVASRFYMRAARFERLYRLPAQDLHGRNIKKLLHEEFGIAVMRIAQRYRLAPVPDAIAASLELPAGSFVLETRAVGFASDGAPVYYQEMWSPPRREFLCAELDVPA